MEVKVGVVEVKGCGGERWWGLGKCGVMGEYGGGQ